MGACASKPKDFDKNDGVTPEAPVSPKKTDVEVVALEENKEGEETKKEEPLVDLSEPAPKAEEVAAAAVTVPEPTPKPAVEEKAAAAVEENKAPKVEEKKESVVAPATSEVKTAAV